MDPPTDEAFGKNDLEKMHREFWEAHEGDTKDPDNRSSIEGYFQKSDFKDLTFPAGGKRVRLLVACEKDEGGESGYATEDEKKIDIVQKWAEWNIKLPKGADLEVEGIGTESGVDNELYDENATLGAYNRTLYALRHSNNNWSRCKKLPDTQVVGTLLVVCVEKYIRLSVSAEDDPVGYELVTIYNARTKEMASAVSRGVRIPEDYVNEALNLDYSAKKQGNYTDEGVLTANVEGLAPEELGVSLTGISWDILLWDALDKLRVPYASLKDN